MRISDWSSDVCSSDLPLSRLIVISNRVSAPQPEQPASQGGLAVALTAALRESDGIWFGWSGDIGARHDLHFETYGGVTSGTIDLSEQDIEEDSKGYAHRNNGQEACRESVGQDG